MLVKLHRETMRLLIILSCDGECVLIVRALKFRHIDYMLLFQGLDILWIDARAHTVCNSVVPMMFVVECLAYPIVLAYHLYIGVKVEWTLSRRLIKYIFIDELKLDILCRRINFCSPLNGSRKDRQEMGRVLSNLSLV